MGKFDILNKFNSAAIVINSKKEVVFRNNVFKRIFPDFVNLERFTHKLNYNVCALISNDVDVHSPIAQALKSPEDFPHISYTSHQITTFIIMILIQQKKATIQPLYLLM